MRRTYRDSNAWRREVLPATDVASAARALSVRQTLAAAFSPKFERAGFRRFHNGGTPLFERRFESWIAELLLRVDDARDESGRLPVRVQFHLSHQRMRDVRAKYWSVPSDAPMKVLSGDIGELELPPGHWAWWIGSEPRYDAEIVDAVCERFFPWLAQFEDGEELLDQLLDRAVPLVDEPTGLEVTLAEGGRRRARRYVQTFFADDETFWEEVDRLGERGRLPEGAPLRRAAALAFTYKLL
ncbi:MAG: hypothetical protein SFX74_02200 [Fimbriimonadaceae bacterium]|nr:hypothetical protein [Fimbriimonadaceae bacterium]